jgi:hypothetical protein
MHFWALVQELVANLCDLWVIEMEFVVLVCRRGSAVADLFVFVDELVVLPLVMIDCCRYTEIFSK